MTRKLFVVAGALAVIFAPRAAAGFRSGDTFDKPVGEGGAGGRYYNGAPGSGGYTCTSCHVRTCNQLCHGDETDAGTLKLDEDRGDKLKEVFAENRWQPSRSYPITIVLKGKHIKPDDNEHGDLFDEDALAAGTGINYAGFVVEAVNDQGLAVGSFDPGEGLIAVGGGRVLATLPNTNRIRWTFTYNAPAAGTGRLTFYLAAVASIGAGRDEARESYVRAIDFTDDDVFVMEPVVVCEADTDCDRSPPDFGGGGVFESPTHRYGCGSADPSGSNGIGMMLCLLLVLGAWRGTRYLRRHSRSG